MHPERDGEMIPSLLTFKSHLDNLLQQSFNSEDLFSQSLRESFEWFINRRRDKPAEYIAKYLDNLLRKGDKGLTAPGESASHSLEQEMDRVLILFRFVHGKDVFEAFYKKDLAKRLLLAKSASADAERSMLTKLKNGIITLHLYDRVLLILLLECGAQFTQKLEGMFKDIDVSQDFIKSFKEQRHASQVERNLHVNVLSQSWWPTYPEKEVILPESMVNALESFKEFWLKKQSGRKLMWRHSLGHCILSADFPKVHSLSS
jgi:cullin 4